jgi:reverse gyrase
MELRKILQGLVSREELVKELEKRTLASLRTVNGKLYLLLPDAPTYLQASGRTSRMYAGGLSKGLSVVVASDRRLLEALMKQVAWYTDDASWVKLEELDLAKVLAEIDEDRELIRELARGSLKREFTDIVKTALVVVESPTKARTIASFFGRPSRRNIEGLPVYEVSVGNMILLVAASKGHVLDLIVGDSGQGENRGKTLWGVVVENGNFVPIYATIKKCRACGEQFTEGKDGACPYCGSTDIADQASVIDALRKVAGEVDLVLLATDPDTEGEKIAWDLYALLKPYTGVIKRIEFHEVTRRAFEEALKNQRDVDLKRVEAQLVRRIEDRWIGFSLSMKLWERFGSRRLSAGRVQTPVLGWVVERYKEVKGSYKTMYTVRLENGWVLTFETDFIGKEARELESKLGESYAKVEKLGSEISTLPPPPPFTTDTLLGEVAAAA